MMNWTVYAALFNLLNPMWTPRVVSFIPRTYDRIRIISARSATRRERIIYEETPRF